MNTAASIPKSDDRSAYDYQSYAYRDIAEKLARTGQCNQARNVAKLITSDVLRDEVIGEIDISQLDISDPAGALQKAKRPTNANSRTAALNHLAVAFARNGRTKDAFAAVGFMTDEGWKASAYYASSLSKLKL